MKILLQFSTKNLMFAKDYRRVILSFFKKSLSEAADGKYFEEYYQKPERRNFTFAVNLPSPKFSKSAIELSKNEFRVTFSTADSKTGFIFMSSFIGQLNKQFNAPLENTFFLKSVNQITERTVNTNSALVKMQSPLCIREHSKDDNKDYYLSVADDEFSNKASILVKTQLIADGFDEKFVENFELVPLNAKKTVIFHYGNSIECSLGEFILNADKSVINYLLKSGIGSRKSAGFGFAELIAEG